MVGNPPYVRQELLSPIKPYLQGHYQTYHGMADLYVYFYERGVEILKPGGRLAFVVTNKWMKAGYGEPLRRFFGEKTWVEQVVDFGHAKQFFKDADVFPCFLVVRKPAPEDKPVSAQVSIIPRDIVRVDQLPTLIKDHRTQVAIDRAQWRRLVPRARRGQRLDSEDQAGGSSPESTNRFQALSRHLDRVQ